MARQFNFHLRIRLSWAVKKEIGGRMGFGGLAALFNREQRCEIHRREQSVAGFATGAGENHFVAGVEPHVVGIATQVHPRTFCERACVEAATGAVAATAHHQAVLFANEDKPLWFADAGDFVDALPFRKVNHFDGVVFQTGDKQALRLDIHGQMIEPAFHAVQRHDAAWNQAL